jgi:hypothetical protein
MNTFSRRGAEAQSLVIDKVRDKVRDKVFPEPLARRSLSEAG